MTRREFNTKAQLMFAGLFCGAALAGNAFGQTYRYSAEHRRPVEATIHDLEEISSRHPGEGRERERYDNAIHHLQEFGERLHEGGGFDKGKLDQAIEDVQNVINHNRLGERGRDVLTRDVAGLRDLREHYDDRQRYR